MSHSDSHASFDFIWLTLFDFTSSNSLSIWSSSFPLTIFFNMIKTFTLQSKHLVGPQYIYELYTLSVTKMLFVCDQTERKKEKEKS